MEFFDLLDENGCKTGVVKERSLVHTDGDRHGTVHTWIFRRIPGAHKNKLSSYEVLLQKRSADKDAFPGCYDIASAGHISAGQTPSQAVTRELEEELGLKREVTDLRFVYRHEGYTEMEFYEKPFRNLELSWVYLLLEDIDTKTLTLQQSEVESVTWLRADLLWELTKAQDEHYCIYFDELEAVSRFLLQEENMTKIDIFSGFLGAGKTTLIKKLLKEAFAGQKIVLIENEFGEIGIDGGFLKDAGIEITEMNSGCICCSLVGDFGTALKQVLDQYAPERILIEPSGVGKLSDVIAAVAGVVDNNDNVEMGAFVTVVDAVKCKMYMKNFGEFFNNQIENATTIILSRSQKVSEEKMAEIMELLRAHNAKAAVVTTPWDLVDGKTIVTAMEPERSMAEEMMKELIEKRHHHDDDDDDDEVCPHCGGHHHHHHDDDDECCCHDHEHEHHHHHDDDDEDDEECCCHDHEHEHHHHHHHDEEEECCCHDHEHHHHHDDDDDEECCCHDHDHEHEHHHHHHHHHADEVFTSWGVETPKKFDKEELEKILDTLSESEEYGVVLRAKGIVPCTDGTWLHFDMTPGEGEVRTGSSDYTGRICVIGSKIKESALAVLFGVADANK